MLCDNVTYHEIRFTGTGRPQHHYSAKWVNDIDPTITHLIFQLITGRQVDGIFVFQQAFFLWKRLILPIKNVFIIEPVTDNPRQ